VRLQGDHPKQWGELRGGTETVVRFPKVSGATERELALRQSHREDGVFDVLIEVLEETPEVLSVEYSDDLLCDLVRSHLPDVTTLEIVRALDMLSARTSALGELMQKD